MFEMKNELEDKILAILEQHQVGVLTSVQGDYPHARYMTFLHDGLTLYTPSGKELPKTEEVRRPTRIRFNWLRKPWFCIFRN